MSARATVRLIYVFLMDNNGALRLWKHSQHLLVDQSLDLGFVDDKKHIKYHHNHTIICLKSSPSALQNLQLSQDVAGATFMAAGSSAPELFTSLIGQYGDHLINNSL